MPTALDAGKAFLTQVLEKLPPEARAQAEAAFTSAEASAAVAAMGEGALRQADYSRLMDAAREQQTRAQQLYEQNTAWFNENKAALEALPGLQAEVARLSATPPADPKDPPKAPATEGVTLEMFQGVIRESLGLFAVIPPLVAKHQAVFGEVLTDEALAGIIQQAQQHNRTVKQQYEITFAEQLKAKATEQETAKLEKIKADAVAEYLRANPNLPYPVRSSGQDTSPLTGLTQKIDPASLNPEALAAEYSALVAGKV